MENNNKLVATQSPMFTSGKIKHIIKSRYHIPSKNGVNAG